MGYMSANVIEDGAYFLLAVLKEKGEVAYSVFYDGTDETADALHEGMGLEVGESAECALDLAAVQLKEQGLVSLEDLEAELADGLQDYAIALTDKGREWCAKPFALTFRDME